MPINVIKSPSLCQHRDLRSTSVPYKRDKDHSEKWSHHGRLASNLPWSSAGEAEQSKTEDVHIKSLSSKPWNASVKTSKMAKVGWPASKVNGRPNTKNVIDIDDNDCFVPKHPHSLPQKTSCYDDLEQNTVPTATVELDIPDPLYSFDIKGPSPGVNGRNVELEKLVEMAEKKWEGKMTDKIVEGEYEVLDAEGENITLTKKGKKNMKLKSRPPQIQSCSEAVDEDDGFELI
ncbi:hypothetical protein OnM2_043084 [Erysiphe neolycopersici]|uniref:Uncharacterized protein n=1 Tax=Erysiphe neolycopersici TaxID=212602 RepID=A0A420HVA7_9PEZI|nr:hypothetical protein OnM2_043084 [Erysiphe neolycopersici]